MLKMGHFDPVERRREKARARAEDDHALRNGLISRSKLQERNSFLAPLEIVSSASEHRSVLLCAASRSPLTPFIHSRLFCTLRPGRSCTLLKPHKFGTSAPI